MTQRQHESVQSVHGQHVPMICLALSRIWAAVHPHFRFQIQMAHHCCCRCPAIVSCLAALYWCLNHQLMIRRHRQNRRSLCSGHESRQVVIINCSAKLKPAIHHAITPSTSAALVASPSSNTSSKVVSTSSQVVSGEKRKSMITTPNCELHFDRTLVIFVR